MDDVRGYFLGPPHSTTPAAVTTNKTTKGRSFKSRENILKKEGGSDCTVLNNKLFSDPELTGNESQRKHIVISSFNKAVKF